MRTGLILTTTLAGIAVSVCAAAADGSLNGPVSAYVYDTGTRSVRGIPGVPGAAYVGDAIADGIDSAAFAPDGLRGLYVKEGALHLLRQPGNGEWTASRIGDASAGALIVWSSNSATAAVIDGSAATIWKADGSRAGTIGGIGGRVVAAALDGESLVAAVASDAGSGIYLYAPELEPKLLARADAPAGIAIAGSDVFFADRLRNEIWTLRNYREAAEPRLVANIEDPAGVGAADDAVVFVSAAARKAVSLRIGSGEPLFELALDFEPSGVERFGKAGWLLNGGKPGPLQVLVGGQEPAVYFIPRGQERNDSAQ